jgi:hypothetical protein
LVSTKTESIELRVDKSSFLFKGIERAGGGAFENRGYGEIFRGDELEVRVDGDLDAVDVGISCITGMLLVVDEDMWLFAIIRLGCHVGVKKSKEAVR